MQVNRQHRLLTLAAFAVLWLPLLSAAGCQQPNRGNEGCTRPRLIVFTASWCKACQRDKPLVLQIEAAGVEVRVYDIDKSPDLARRHGVTVVPTYLYYACGQTAVRVNTAAEVLVLVNRSRSAGTNHPHPRGTNP